MAREALIIMKIFCQCGNKITKAMQNIIKLVLVLLAIFIFINLIKNVLAEDMKLEKRTYMKQLLCTQHEDLVNNLITAHGESRKWWAINSSRELVELFVNDSNGAWTIIISKNSGIACGLVGGDHSGANFDVDNPSGDNL